MHLAIHRLPCLRHAVQVIQLVQECFGHPNRLKALQFTDFAAAGYHGKDVIPGLSLFGAQRVAPCCVEGTIKRAQCIASIQLIVVDNCLAKPPVLDRPCQHCQDGNRRVRRHIVNAAGKGRCQKRSHLKRLESYPPRPEPLVSPIPSAKPVVLCHRFTPLVKKVDYPVAAYATKHLYLRVTVCEGDVNWWGKRVWALL